MGRPGWPELALSTASAERKRMASAQSRALSAGMTACCIAAPFGSLSEMIETLNTRVIACAVGEECRYARRGCYYTNRYGPNATVFHDIRNFFSVGNRGRKAKLVLLAAGKEKGDWRRREVLRRNTEGRGDGYCV